MRQLLLTDAAPAGDAPDPRATAGAAPPAAPLARVGGPFLVIAALAEALRRSEARFRALVQHSSDALLVVDAAGTVRYQSASVGRLWGYAPGVLEGVSLAAVAHDEDAATADAALAGVAGGGPGATARGEWRVRRADGACVLVEVAATNLLADPDVGGVVLTARDVTERRALERELQHRASHDPLTGLGNRALFLERCERALAAAARGGHHMGALFVDLDGFKGVNDSLGHAAGDQLLVRVAERLLNATRGSDTVARLGGDEFAVLLERVRDEGDVRMVAERVTAALRAPAALEGREVAVSGSVGAVVAAPGEAAAELLARADAAMYAAKAGGKARFALGGGAGPARAAA